MMPATQAVGGARHRGRELALRALYQADVLGESRAHALAQILEDPAPLDPDALAAFAEAHPDQELRPTPVDTELAAFVSRLVNAVDAHAAEIDRTLEEAAENWSLGRMAAVDRNVLRLGAAEILYCPEVPLKVVLNEAILLAKRYGGAQSGGFVNGILDRVAARARQP